MKHCWGVSGDTLNYVTDAIRRSGIKWGGFAAGAEALPTGELAACADSCGPAAEIASQPRAADCRAGGGEPLVLPDRGPPGPLMVFRTARWVASDATFPRAS